MQRLRIYTASMFRPKPMHRARSYQLTYNSYCSQPGEEVDHGFEEFKRKHGLSLEGFKRRYSSRKEYQDRTDDVWQRAYDWHCRIEYTHYEMTKNGGNPARML